MINSESTFNCLINHIWTSCHRVQAKIYTRPDKQSLILIQHSADIYSILKTTIQKLDQQQFVIWRLNLVINDQFFFKVGGQSSTLRPRRHAILGWNCIIFLPCKLFFHRHTLDSYCRVLSIMISSKYSRHGRKALCVQSCIFFSTCDVNLYCQTSNIRHQIPTSMFLFLPWSCLCSIHWSQVLSQEWRCSWSSASRRCSNYIWVINNLMA